MPCRPSSSSPPASAASQARAAQARPPAAAPAASLMMPPPPPRPPTLNGLNTTNTLSPAPAGRRPPPHNSLANAARLLGVSRPTLYNLLETHGMALPRNGREPE